MLDCTLMSDITDEETRHQMALGNLLQLNFNGSHICSISVPAGDDDPRFKRISPPPKPLCVRINVAAQMIGIGKTKMYELIKTGEVDTLKIGKSTLVTMASLEAFVQKHLRCSTL